MLRRCLHSLILTILDAIILTSWLAFTLNVGVAFGFYILALGLLARNLLSSYLTPKCFTCYDEWDEEDD